MVNPGQNILTQETIIKEISSTTVLKSYKKTKTLPCIVPTSPIIAIFRFTSPIVITVPNKGSLAIETKVSLVSVIGTCDRITKNDVYKQISQNSGSGGYS